MKTAPKLGDTQYDNINPLDLIDSLYPIIDYSQAHFELWSPVYELADRAALPLLEDAAK